MGRNNVILLWTDVMMDRFDDEQNYQNINKILCFLLQMKGCIKVLKEQAPDSVEGLLNALR